MDGYTKVNIRILQVQLDFLKAKAARMGCPYNFLIRQAIERYIDAAKAKAEEKKKDGN